MVKLQNFSKKVYCIGVVDDILDDPTFAQGQQDQWKKRIAANAALIRNFTKELQADTVVLELCEERYQDELMEILSHPNYDRTLNTVHRLLTQNPDKLLTFD